MRSSDEIDQLAAALADAQGEFQAITKNAENPFFHSSYADLPAVVMAASPVLSSHGLSVSQMPDFDGEHDLLTTRLMHSSGQWLEASMRLHAPKADPQGQGSALTYARRYAYSGCVGVVTEADDDAEAATQRAPRKQQHAKTVASHSRPSELGELARNSESAETATTKQLNFLRTVLAKDHQLTEDTDIAVVVSTWVGRDIADLSELTKAECSRAIDRAREDAQ